jgi:hypothetical protein
VVLAGLAAAPGLALAQADPVTRVTGTVDVVLDGVARTFHAYAVERVDARTLRIRGSIDGVFVFRAGPGAAPEGAPAVVVGSGRFDLLEVVGSVDLDSVTPVD